MRMTVIGTGYVGLVHAVCMADIGHEVLGVDTDEAWIAALTEGHSPIHEPGLDELLTRTLASGRLRFSTSLADAARFADVHFVCVGTPQMPGGEAADVRQVDAVIDGMAPLVRPGSLIIGKSTVPVGTTARLGARLRAVAPHSEVAVNPEFLREGFAVSDTRRPERIVVGAESRRAEMVLREIYEPMLISGARFFSTDPATAELVKVASNAFLATKISFINAMAEVCDAAGADVVTLADAVGQDSRIGHRFLQPGLGFGGSCFPKDIRAFAARAEELGVGEAIAFLRQVDEINLRQRTRTVDLARDLVGGSFTGRHVGVLGAAFKPGSDDVRDSPALEVASAIRREGAEVRVHDPEALDNARRGFPELQYAFDVPKACEDADLVLHLTAWPEYRDISPDRLASVVRSRKILDARDTLDATTWQSAGWTLSALGRPPTNGTYASA
ncbi:UDP-glucose dehydrogenase family protein [Streptomyces ossamyceticus]|uniref:UDP-glucose dehydrogenase family protein n=1 Tax=Streptomyces ossamyceticus TaxID=249581 RepID=UPI0036E9EAF7